MEFSFQNGNMNNKYDNFIFTACLLRKKHIVFESSEYQGNVFLRFMLYEQEIRYSKFLFGKIIGKNLISD